MTQAAIAKSSAETSPAAIELSGISVKYRLWTDAERTLKGRFLSAFGKSDPQTEFWALRGVSLRLQQGQVVGIVGQNGSGKTTLLRVMAGVLFPAEGSVRIAGHVTPILDLTGALNPDASGRENAFIHAALHKIPRQKMESLLPRVADFAELGPFFDVPLKTYSAGMVARLAFSLATLIDPEILLIDEVLAVGDERFQRKSLFRMHKLIERGSLVVIVSHNSSMLEQLCNRVIMLEGGQVVADGVPSAVIAEYRRRSR